MVLIETERRLAACLQGDLPGYTAMNIVHVPRLSYFRLRSPDLGC